MQTNKQAAEHFAEQPAEHLTMTPQDRHRLHYLDLRPEPLERAQREPSALALLAGAALACAALWCVALFLLSF